MARNSGEHIALVSDVFDLLQTDDCGRRLAGSWPRLWRVHTVDLAENLQCENLVLVAVLGVFNAHQPHTRKGT